MVIQADSDGWWLIAGGTLLLVAALLVAENIVRGKGP